MPDDDKIVSPATAPVPAATATPVPAWMMKQSDEQLARDAERRWIDRMLASHDAARASAGRSTLIAVTDFTIVDDENPDGRVVHMGEEFEISDFDLPKYLGRGLFKLDDPRRNTTNG